jgi:MoxR-like ATPase
MSARDQSLELKWRITASVIGQEAGVDLLLIALLADGHLLMEGLPGLAKNPVEQEGTYPLPEAQMDRFLPPRFYWLSDRRE